MAYTSEPVLPLTQRTLRPEIARQRTMEEICYECKDFCQ
jgi:hypothetical protein